MDDQFCPCFYGCFSLNLKLGYGVLVFWWELTGWVISLLKFDFELWLVVDFPW